MPMKKGRGRKYPAYDGIGSELEYLVELRARTNDLVEDLPEDILSKELNGCTIQQLLDHMIEAELSWISRTAGIQKPASVSDLNELDRFARNALSGLDLGSQISVGPFTSVGQVLRNSQWHWSYHSAQICFLRKAFGHEYEWRYEE